MNITNNNPQSFGWLKKPNQSTQKVLDKLIVQAKPETVDSYIDTMAKIAEESKDNPIAIQEYVKTYSDKSKAFGIKMNGVPFDQHYHTSLNSEKQSADDILKSITRQNELAAMQADVIYTKVLEQEEFIAEQKKLAEERLKNLYQ